ncbi:MAG: ThuA domain-containing protein, partial [Chloroflexi bacterium]|nr:ThuA domain-containing protein [Chloroflexota bacterium]
MSNHLTRRAFLQRTAVSAGALALGRRLEARPKPGVALVWSEGSAPRSVYPQDINHAIAEGLAPLRGWTIRTAGLNDPDQGLGDSALDEADVIIWWGHLHHGDVRDDRADSVVQRVKAGTLGFIGTHSAHWSKPFTRLMGTSCSWLNGYIEDGSRVDVRVADRRHPIARGIRDFVIPHT